MLDPNKNFLFIFFQWIVSSFEDINNGKKIFNIGFVSNFYKNHFFRKKIDKYY